MPLECGTISLMHWDHFYAPGLKGLHEHLVFGSSLQLSKCRTLRFLPYLYFVAVGSICDSQTHLVRCICFIFSVSFFMPLDWMAMGILFMFCLAITFKPHVMETPYSTNEALDSPRLGTDYEVQPLGVPYPHLINRIDSLFETFQYMLSKQQPILRSQLS